ncbi:MAG: fructosamine kinase family protein [Vicingaceae bacterium]|nr:MAG: fructosamine kinase family protein [Vicingaceae bacterium]
MHFIKDILLKHKLIKNNEPVKIKSIGGGCINDAYLAATDAGNFFIKTKSICDENHLCEKENLEIFLNYGIPAPEPYCQGCIHGISYLVMEYLPDTRFQNEMAIAAHIVAKLHSVTHKDNLFGWHRNNFIGSISQHNVFSDNWTEFYLDYRIRPLLKQSFEMGYFDKEEVKLWNNLMEKTIPDLLPQKCASSLLHGDLWYGNIHFSNKQAYLIDPASYYGHYEVDLAMAKLFGGFDNQFFNQYFELKEYPDKYFNDRMLVYQIYPLLVHLILFGWGYKSQLISILKHFR